MSFTNNVALASLIAIAASSPAEAGRFYLSSDKVFAPGEAVSVKVEAQGAPSLDVRLYRLDDPAKWFLEQTDLHRPRVENTAPRPSTISLLKRGARFGLGEMLGDARAAFGETGRKSLKAVTSNLHQAAVEGPAVVEAKLIVPPLTTHALLEAWRVLLPERGGWVYDEISIPVTAPGAYLVEAVADGEIAHTVVLVSDVALVTKQSSDALLVWAVDPATGAPRPDTNVTVRNGASVMGEKKTDSDGLARFDVGLVNAPVIHARNGESFTLLDPRFFSANLPEPRVYVFTERPVYRPGQDVFFKGFAREVKDENYVLPTTGAPVSVSILDPEGNELTTIEVPMSERGSFDGTFTLPSEPAMGTWQVVATVDNKRHGGQFKVMSYVKPEVRLSVLLDDKVARAGDGVAGEIEGAYFFGAPYPSVDVKITVTRTRFHIPWYVDADYAFYYSESEYQNTKREVILETSCVLDDKGRCPFEFTTKADSLDYTYVVDASATDPTGKTITGQSSATVTQGAFRLVFDQSSLVKKPGTTEDIVVVAEDYNRRPRPGESVVVTVRGRHLDKNGALENVEVARETKVSDKDGRIVLPLKLARGGYYEIVAAAKDDKGTTVTAETFLFASDGGADLPFSPPDLEIVTDKRSYFAGDTAMVLVLVPNPDATVLFTVEGGALYRADVVKAKGHAMLITVDVGQRQTPNFYVGASTVFGGKVYTRQRSVIVPPREKLLSVEVSPDRMEAQPGEDVTFTVTARDHAGNPAQNAEVALGVVDEAIYAISPEIAVPLEGFFHHRKRNDVRTEESVSFRFFGTSRGVREKDAMRTTMSSFAFGSMKPQLDDVRKVFKDTAGFFASLITDDQGIVKATVTLPDNLTSWRATARVLSSKTAVGMAVGHVRAKKPLMVRVALPPRLTEGDKGAGAIIVQNLSGKEQVVTLGVTSNADNGAALELTTSGKGGALPTSLTVADGASARVPFVFQVTGAGQVSLKVEAEGSGVKDSLLSSVPVTAWRSRVRSSANGFLSDAKRTAAHTLTLEKSAVSSSTFVEIDILPSSMAALKRALPYLIGFPHGCTEQTMSRFLPVLAADNAAKRLKIPLGEAEKDLPRMIAFGQERLLQLQHDDGGWGWWEEDASDAFLTAWVLEGLAEAKALGTSIDEARFARGRSRLVQLLSGKKNDVSDDVRAFSVYALARAGKPQPAMVKALVAKAKTQRASTFVTALTMLAAHTAGDKDAVNDLVPVLVAAARENSAGVSFSAMAVDDAFAHLVRAPEHDPREETAWAVIALHRAGGHDAMVQQASNWLLSQFDDGRFGTTRQTAVVVRALAESLGATSQAPPRVKIAVGGELVVDEQLASMHEPVTKRLPRPNTGNVVVTLAVDGAPVSYAVALVGENRAARFAARGSTGLSVKRTVYALTGPTGAWKRGAPVTSVKSGDAVLVQLDVMAPSEVPFVMVADKRAAGLSPIERDQTLVVEGVDLRRRAAHRSHNDDETVFFVSRIPPGKTTFSYLARAGLSGTYRVLPTEMESMYLPATHHAVGASSEFTVEAP